MKTIFIAYADEKMAFSLKRIGRLAKRLNIFDEVILYSPTDLPEDFKSIQLMQHSYGGGYWAWKPWIIQHTLDTHQDGDIVCYVDAGCTLNKAPEWNEYLNLMQLYDTLLFEYPDEMSIWKKFGSTSTKIKHWTKKESILFYDELNGEKEWREHNKIWGGSVWAKGKNNPIIKEWLDIIYNHPEVIDDSGVFDEQFPFFARHKHDQPTLTALSCKYKDNCYLLTESADGSHPNAPIIAERIRVKNGWEYIIYLFKKYVRKVVGLETINKLKLKFR